MIGEEVSTLPLALVTIVGSGLWSQTWVGIASSCMVFSKSIFSLASVSLCVKYSNDVQIRLNKST